MNKGEASEFYAFLYILGNKVLNLVDKNLNKTGSKVGFLNILRDGATYEFTDHDRIKIQSRGQVSYIEREKVREDVSKLLKEICTLPKIPDDNAVFCQVMKLTASDKSKSKSSDKSDLLATVKFPQVPFSQYLGFSIKSYIGNNPTVLNASNKNTQFICTVLHGATHPSGRELEKLKNLYKTKNTLAQFYRNIMREGFQLVFKNTGTNSMTYNLRLIDSHGPELVARLLYEQYAFEGMVSIDDLVKSLARKNDMPEVRVLGSDEQERYDSLKYKIQSFLLAFTTGAIAGRKWRGIDEASGGLLVVEKDGEVVCLELVTRNAIGAYLIESAYFETPSRNRHPHGNLKVDPVTGEVTIDLQLQIRLKHPQR